MRTSKRKLTEEQSPLASRHIPGPTSEQSLGDREHSDVGKLAAKTSRRTR